jgi:hypothetical protein
MASKRPELASKTKYSNYSAYYSEILELKQLDLYLDLNSRLKTIFKERYLEIAYEELEWSLKAGQKYFIEFLYAFISDKSLKRMKQSNGKHKRWRKEKVNRVAKNNLRESKILQMTKNGISGGYEK